MGQFRKRKGHGFGNLGGLGQVSRNGINFFSLVFLTSIEFLIFQYEIIFAKRIATEVAVLAAATVLPAAAAVVVLEEDVAAVAVAAAVTVPVVAVAVVAAVVVVVAVVLPAWSMDDGRWSST